jgi:hypothetical protein
MYSITDYVLNKLFIGVHTPCSFHSAFPSKIFPIPFIPRDKIILREIHLKEESKLCQRSGKEDIIPNIVQEIIVRDIGAVFFV